MLYNYSRKIYYKLQADTILQQGDYPRNMITDSFDVNSPPIIQNHLKENAPEVDACIITFSNEIEKYVTDNFADSEIGSLKSVSGRTPIYEIKRNNRRFAFYRTYVGAAVTAAFAEDMITKIKCRKIILFGGAGCLNKEIAHGKVMIPTAAYRDEGTSYHYAPAADYITINNSQIVARCMEENKIPYVLEKHGQQMRFTVKQRTILKSGNQKAAFPLRWKVQDYRPCAISKTSTSMFSSQVVTYWTQMSGIPVQPKDRKAGHSMIINFSG